MYLDRRGFSQPRSGPSHSHWPPEVSLNMSHSWVSFTDMLLTLFHKSNVLRVFSWEMRPQLILQLHSSVLGSQ